jgi:hypothetical protein
METKILIDAAELLRESYSNLPVVIKDRILMAPGKWNDIDYTADEIDNAFDNSNFDDKSIISLYADHEDQSADTWAGYVRNLYKAGGGVVKGDLEVWNPLIGIYLDKAKAKFGISPKLKGFETPDGRLRNFTFENFSVVTNPAVKKAYINLSDKLKGGNKMTEEISKQVIASEIEVEEELAKKGEDKEKKKEEENKKKDEKYPKEELKKKKEEYPRLEEECMSEEDILTITSNSDWTDFVKKMREKDPKISFKEIAKQYKEKQNSEQMLESLSDSELIEKLSQLTALLKKRNKYPYPAEEKMTSDISSLKTQNEELAKEIKTLSARLNEPNSKTVTLSSQAPMSGSFVKSEGSSAINAMADWLKENAGKGGRIF